MARKPNHTDDEIDNVMVTFLANEEHLPTKLEILEILPNGISNDRITAARKRVSKDEMAARPVTALAQNNPGCQNSWTYLKALPASIGAAIDAIETVQREEVAKLKGQIKTLRADLDRIKSLRKGEAKLLDEYKRHEAWAKFEAKVTAIAKTEFDALFSSEDIDTCR